MAWQLVIVDNGVTEEVQQIAGKHTVHEWDYFAGERETDDGIVTHTGNIVFQSALSVCRAYDVVDLKIGSPAISAVPEILVEQALDDTIDAADNGAHIGAINMSFGFTTYPSCFIDEINELANEAC